MDAALKATVKSDVDKKLSIAESKPMGGQDRPTLTRDEGTQEPVKKGKWLREGNLVRISRHGRERPINFQHAECPRRRGKKEVHKHSTFIANPYRFTKKLLGQKHRGHMSCPEDGINCYMREQDLGQCAALISPPETSTLFNINKITQSMRSSSWPGHSQPRLECCTGSLYSTPDF